MTLLQVRQKFVEACGRFDLVSDYEAEDYTDNGADYFIQAGLRILEAMVDTFEAGIQVWKKDIIAGTYQLLPAYLRQAEEVWAYDQSSDARTQLTQITHSEMLDKYGESFDNVSQGTPAYWCRLARPATGQETYDDMAAFVADLGNADYQYDYTSVLFNKDYTNSGILIMPPADASYTISLYGRFHSFLTGDGDYNFWSVRYPELVIMAACLSIEMHYRNSQGVRDWLGSIDLYVKGLDRDAVYEEVALSGGTQLRG